MSFLESFLSKEPKENCVWIFPQQILHFITFFQACFLLSDLDKLKRLIWNIIPVATRSSIFDLNTGTPRLYGDDDVCIFKVHIFWEGHKILRNLPLTFDYSTYSQGKVSQNFVASSEYREFLPNANFITANFITAVFQNYY